MLKLPWLQHFFMCRNRVDFVASKCKKSSNCLEQNQLLYLPSKSLASSAVRACCKLFFSLKIPMLIFKATTMALRPKSKSQTYKVLKSPHLSKKL